jgi:hypothetical protein
MVIIVSYHVDRALYFSAATKHSVSLSTTEYTYKNDVLVHLQYGQNLGIRLNNLLRYEFRNNKDIQDEQFFFKKAYGSGKPKAATRSAFDAKLRGFDLGQTIIEQEILEEYGYTDCSGEPASVQIVVKEKASKTTAAIDFKDETQHTNFIRPAWLTPMESGNETHGGTHNDIRAYV